jgi:hypothetical protein
MSALYVHCFTTSQKKRVLNVLMDSLNLKETCWGERWKAQENYLETNPALLPT